MQLGPLDPDRGAVGWQRQAIRIAVRRARDGASRTNLGHCLELDVANGDAGRQLRQRSLLGRSYAFRQSENKDKAK